MHNRLTYGLLSSFIGNSQLMKHFELWVWRKARVIVSRVKARVDRKLAILEGGMFKRGNRG
jgi:hypothetical protein